MYYFIIANSSNPIFCNQGDWKESSCDLYNLEDSRFILKLQNYEASNNIGYSNQYNYKIVQAII